LGVFQKKIFSVNIRTMFQNECVHSIGNVVNDDIASYEELDGINIMTFMKIWKAVMFQYRFIHMTEIWQSTNL
jgi:hypothetical protein